ncbi:hypothetical protein N0V90_001950 [Kalmusia sp. IMI 367209]|nr:hypothetical protein N0V90_001950 [Kalmusia sp. IMI 367209]
MRLLQLQDDDSLSLVEFIGNNIPRYAILSHTWGSNDEEVNFQDIKNGTGTCKIGWRKIYFCGQQAKKDDLQYFWVDTCCIDKTSSSELTEAINSMFHWYRIAERCYVYLSDVSTANRAEYTAAFRNSRWFTRGWTLQELLAPKRVEFFSMEGNLLGDRCSLVQEITNITGIPDQALQGESLSQFSFEERMKWAEKRETKRGEDMAYSLLGIFNIHMPLIYGEGKTNAFQRLRRKIEKEFSSRRIATEKTGDDIPIGSDEQPMASSSNQPQGRTCQEHFPQVQGEDLSVLMVALKGQMTQLSNQLNDQRHASQSQPVLVSENMATAMEHIGPTESIERLQAVMSKEGQMFDEEAEPLLDDLECILSSISKAPNDRPSTTSKRKWKESGNTEEISSRTIKRLCGMVASSHSVILNAGPHRSKLAKKRMVLQKRTVRELATDRHEITIEQWERSFATFQTNQNQPRLLSNMMETLTRIKVFKRSGIPTVLTAYLHYIQEQAGMRSLHPIISVGRILPDESPILAIVRKGDVDQLQYLLNQHRGADVNARTSCAENCLSIALLSLDMDIFVEQDIVVEQDIDIMILLIERGADIFARDISGRSIFDQVYECHHDGWYSFGGYKGDLWDAVLSRCGYTELMRQPDERSRHYTKKYTPEHFRRLWKGREHLCPYIPEHSRPCPFYYLIPSSLGESNGVSSEEHLDSEGGKCDEDDDEDDDEEELLELNSNDEFNLTDFEQNQPGLRTMVDFFWDGFF